MAKLSKKMHGMSWTRNLNVQVRNIVNNYSLGRLFPFNNSIIKNTSRYLQSFTLLWWIQIFNSRLCAYFWNRFYFDIRLFINPNMPGGIKLTPCGFWKNVSSIERVEPCFFVTFNIILKEYSDETLSIFWKSPCRKN